MSSKRSARERASVREWRDRRAFSLSELAALSRVHRITIHRIEHGLQAPYPATRRKLAEALDIAVDRIDWQCTQAPAVAAADGSSKGRVSD